MATVNNNDGNLSESAGEQRPFVADSTSRTMSLDIGSFDSRMGHSSSRHGNEGEISDMLASSTKAHAAYGLSGGYRQRYPHLHKRSEHLRSVVTTSFSVDDERDDIMRGYACGPSNFSFEQHMDRNARRRGDDEREGWNASAQVVYFAPSTPSPKSRIPDRHYLHRTYSSSGYFVPSESMKRSYYHHSVTMNPYQNSLPPEFMPPMKRTRHEPVRKEIYVSPSDDVESQSVVQRAQSFPLRPLPPHSHVPQSPNGFPYHTHYMPPSPSSKYAQVSPGSDIDESPRSWNGEMIWTPSPYGAGSHFWGSPRNGPHHPPLPSPKKKAPNHSPISSRSHVQDHQKSAIAHRPSGDEKMRMMVEAAAKANTELRESFSSEESSPYMLLALPDDRMSLSETLCVVRENIEVFTASQADVDAPAPGRKHAVEVGQVGLRCIHCRHTIRNSDRVKRAVCYPSSIKRIYRTVIDMKLDHFTQCKFVPMSLKNHLSELKAVHTRSTGTTMLYFIKAAKSQGMEDGPSGVVLGEGKDISLTNPTKSLIIQEPQDKPPSPLQQQQKDVRRMSNTNKLSRSVVTRCDSLSSGSWTSGDMTQPRIDSMASWSFESPSAAGGGVSSTSNNIQFSPSLKTPTGGANGSDLNFEGVIPLSLPEDKSSLSPLRCFLREQVCAFSATEKDIAVRAPTTFSITVGQVGIGCIHCVQQSARHRSNRAVCFPFSIGRIYQSVADIQRFHFGECQNMPDEVKYQFLNLQSASSKGSKGLATRQYWMSSARKIGLIDTATGIRFGRDPAKPESATSFSLDILAQVAFTVTTASKPLVLPEDKNCIAEFLFVVMEQLQPCRFTEADRNKRRLKDVGCIGVECKHCAGQVDSRKFFWSSVSAVESNFVSVHTHVLECKCVPAPLKDRLLHLKSLRKEQTAALRTGSQKSFFARVWQRLHETDSMIDDDQTLPSSQFREIQKSASASSSTSSMKSSSSVRFTMPTCTTTITTPLNTTTTGSPVTSEPQEESMVVVPHIGEEKEVHQQPMHADRIVTVTTDNNINNTKNICPSNEDNYSEQHDSIKKSDIDDVIAAIAYTTANADAATTTPTTTAITTDGTFNHDNIPIESVEI